MKVEIATLLTYEQWKLQVCPGMKIETARLKCENRTACMLNQENCKYA